MKKLLLLFALLPLFASCDSVDKDDRYIEVEDAPLQRRVLLEEFTGQRCTNCPTAHAVIEKLEEQYGNDLIVVSIHAGNFGIPASDGGLMQEEGDIYAAQWNIKAFPAGVVDRTGGEMTLDGWAGAIRQDGSYPSPMELNLHASLSHDNKTINVTSEVTSPESAKASLQLWVVENGLIGFQIDGGTRLYDYEHNNVFRGCVNGLWGQEFEIGAGGTLNFDNSVAVYTNDEPGYEITSWNVDELYIVGFVYNDSGVLVVNRVKVD